MSRAGKEHFAQKVVELDETVREIAALDDLYEELIHSSPSGRHEVQVKQDEARFARERILKLSLHAKNLVASLEAHETLK